MNPGSQEAVNAGCECPVMDNARGAGYLGGMKDENGEVMFVVNLKCPIHGVKDESQRD